MSPPFDLSSWLTESLHHFQALLRIDTTNPPGNEARAVDYICEVFRREDIAFDRIEAGPGRSNLVARIPGRSAAGALLLNGHLDVVPAENEHWRFDPFSATRADGCIWGRGAIDMKHMVTMSLMVMIAIRRSGIELERGVIFAAVADEEAGCHYGSLHLVDHYPELVTASYVLNEVGGQTLHVGSQKIYPIQVAEKGVCWFELIANGQPGHGSMPHHDNAVVRIARAVEDIARKTLKHRLEPEVEQFLLGLARQSDGPASLMLSGLRTPVLADFLLKLLRFKDASQAGTFSSMLRNTATPTVLSAGSAVNVIPGQAIARFDGRVLPGSSVDEFLADIASIVGTGIRINVLEQHEGVRASSESPLFEQIVTTLSLFDPNATALPYMNPAFTDSFAYARLGAACYGFAPIRLGPEVNFSQMFHGHNERIPIDGYLWGQRALLYTVLSFCSLESPKWLESLVPAGETGAACSAESA